MTALSIQDINLLQSQNEGLKKQNKELQQENARLREELQEIKSITQICTSGIACTECPFTDDCVTDCEAEALGVCKLILQKISEGANE